MKGNLLVSENPIVINNVTIRFKDETTAYIEKRRVTANNHPALLFKLGKILERRYGIDKTKFFSKTKGIFDFENEFYFLDGIPVHLIAKNKAIVKGEEVVAADREQLLLRVGDILEKEGARSKIVFSWFFYVDLYRPEPEFCLKS